MCKVVKVAANLGPLAISLPLVTRCWEPLSGLREVEAVGDIPRILGPAAWSRLTDDIRHRFASCGVAARTTVYRGVMATIHATWLGFLLAQFWRLIGTPLSPCQH